MGAHLCGFCNQDPCVCGPKVQGARTSPRSKKYDYLYMTEVVITNPDDADQAITVYQVWEDGKMRGPEHLEPGRTITRTIQRNRSLVIVHNKTDNLPLVE